jgi:hypothetical protein
MGLYVTIYFSIILPAPVSPLWFLHAKFFKQMFLDIYQHSRMPHIALAMSSLILITIITFREKAGV